MNKETITSKEGVQPAVRELLVELLAAIDSGTITISDVDGLQTKIDDIESRLTALEGGGA
ncbi:hypothetical protein [Virgibacillus sp. Bac332]|uniref:hypothetical protein n=1 Tax=Virgibacillus sp. Bac332 TaxID=2419842 RepID=UPI000EF4DB64|nr:hypothetical protein [Virgibacillus sp. Bac332]